MPLCSAERRVTTSIVAAGCVVLSFDGASA
jgi:hypothetical protein